MKVRLCNLGCIAAMTALLLAGGNLAAKPPAGPNIAPSSCGGVAVPPSGNAFCSFEGDGSGVVIGHHSCNVIGACLLLGNGVRIGNDSCNGDTACAGAGDLGGSAVFGNGSCNGDFGCNFAGYRRYQRHRQQLLQRTRRRCIWPNLLGVCYGVGAVGGSGRIGNNSCNDGVYACLLVASRLWAASSSATIRATASRPARLGGSTVASAWSATTPAMVTVPASTMPRRPAASVASATDPATNLQLFVRWGFRRQQRHRQPVLQWELRL